MSRATLLSLILLTTALSTAQAETVKGEVREELVPEADNKIWIDADDGTSYLLSDPDDAKLFFAFRRERVEVTGTIVRPRPLGDVEAPPPELKIEEVVRPVWRESVRGICRKLRPDSKYKTPALEVEGEGTLRVTGPGFRVLKHALDRRVHVKGWFFADAREPTLHVTRTEARTTQAGPLHELGVKILGHVEADVTVWLKSSSLWGYSAWLYDVDGEAGYYDYEYLEIGTPLEEAPAREGPGITHSLPGGN